jgi:hypothetical protein
MSSPGRLLQCAVQLPIDTRRRGMREYIRPVTSSAAAPPESSRIQSELCPIAYGPAPTGLPCDPTVGGIVPMRQTTAPVYVAVRTTPASATTAKRTAAAVYQASQDRFAQYRSTYVAPPIPMPSLPNPVPVVNPPQCVILRYEGSKPPPPPT